MFISTSHHLFQVCPCQGCEVDIALGMNNILKAFAVSQGKTLYSSPRSSEKLYEGATLKNLKLETKENVKKRPCVT